MMKKRKPKKPNGNGRNTTSGAMLEYARDSLRQHGFLFYENYNSYCRAKKDGSIPSRYPSRHCICNFPHETLYGTEGRKELYIYDEGNAYIVEFKFQNGSGSVDEKFPYVWEAFLASRVPYWIVVYDGHWWKSGRGKEAVIWLKNKGPIPQGREFVVMQRREFAEFVLNRWGHKC
jgi:hypothetical protein